MRIPLGVIAIIYESRPNVTVDAAALCVKAGNAVILRGGSEAIHSNLALAEELRAAAARDRRAAEDAVALVPHHRPRGDRPAAHARPLRRPGDPARRPGADPQGRGRVARIPVIKHDAGVCHVYLDASADPEMARAIVRDSKIRQMAVCNGLETLLCHAARRAHACCPTC